MTMMDALFFIGIVGVVLLIPPRFDPAIRLKEWLERRRRL